MAIYDGTTMRLKFGTKVLFHEVNAKFSTSKEFKELASKDINGKQTTPGSYTWSLSCDSLIANGDGSTQEDVKTLLDYYLADTLVAVEFSTNVAADIVLAGNVYISQCDIDATNEEGVTGSFSFTGNGDFTVGIVAA